jgi:glycosyltransferase involved in cell wall biosynthesis
MAFYIVCDTFGLHRGGIERHALGLASALRKRGAKVELLSTEMLLRKNGLTQEDFVIIEGVHRGALTRLLRATPATSTQSLAIYTHGSFYEFSHFWMLAKQGYQWGLAKNLGSYLFDLWMTRGLLSRIGTIAVMSEAEGRDLSTAFGIDKSRIFVSPNFTGADDYRNSSEFDIAEIPRGSFVFAIGRIESRKNFKSVIPAIDGLGVSFVLAGTDEGGLESVRRTAKKFHRVEFTYVGEISNHARRALIAGCIATILPSYVEGVPFAVLESLELQVPSIVTSLSYVPPWDGVYYCTPSVQSIRSAVVSVLNRRDRVGPIKFPRVESVADELLHRFENF